MSVDIEFVKNRITPWMKRQVFREDAKFGALQKLVLRHMRPDGGAGAEVTTHIPDHTEHPDIATFEILVNELAMAAADHAAGMASGVQRYSLFSYYENLATPPSSFAFYLHADVEGIADGLPSEPANGGGMLAMQMRHNDAILKTSVMSMGQTVAVMQKMIERLSGQNEELLNQRVANIELVERLVDSKHERELKTKKVEREMQIQGELLDRLKLLMPFIANKLAGRTVMPEPTAPENLIVRAFVETLKPDQLDRLRGVLSPEQIIALMDVAQKVMEGSGENPKMSSIPKLRAIAEGKDEGKVAS